MKISAVSVQRFRYLSSVVRDSEGHGHPGPEHDATHSMLTITTDEGASGYAFGDINPEVVQRVLAPLLVGEHPFFRERIWYGFKERQRLNLSTLPDRFLTIVDLALW